MKTSSQTNCSNIDQKSADFCCIIVAAGGGQRFGGEIPKQFLPFSGETVLSVSLKSFLEDERCRECILVIQPSDIKRVQVSMAFLSDEQREKIRTVHGGKERADSVKSGISSLQRSKDCAVLIHDAARPGVTKAVIDNLLSALDAFDGSAPALRIVDAIKRSKSDMIESVDRSDLYRIQTPQAFRFDVLETMYKQVASAAVDDFELAQSHGLSLTLVEGHESLAKITYPEDLTRLEKFLSVKTETRMGSGFDVHAFEDGNSLTLCGVEIPHEKSLKGHSDADVAWHALTDAILGALSDGDIGDHFPPSDPQWKGAPSSVFLKFAGDRVGLKKGRIVNIDLTLICEAPKVKPHREAMRQKTSELLGLDIDRVSVKATTTEQLGFTGRREGIAAQATVSIALPIPSADARD